MRFISDGMSLWHATLAWKQSIDLDYILTVAMVCFDQIADFFLHSNQCNKIILLSVV